MRLPRNPEAALDDIEYNVDLYISNQVVVQDSSFGVIFGWFTRDYYKLSL